MIDAGQIGPPRWVWRALVAIAAFAAVAMIATALASAYIGARRQSQIQESSERADCRTTIGTARQSVFDDVDIYKAILIKAQADQRLYDLVYTEEDLAEFREVDELLDAALVEARRLQPSMVLDRLIERGGMIAGKHYDPCPHV